eukprot:scaffold14521_cov121-Isochrysis_galbana.AAC.11
MVAPALLTLPCPLTGLRIAMVARPNLVARASPALMAITDKADACLKEECSLDMVHDLILELQNLNLHDVAHLAPAQLEPLPLATPFVLHGSIAERSRAFSSPLVQWRRRGCPGRAHQRPRSRSSACLCSAASRLSTKTTLPTSPRSRRSSPASAVRSERRRTTTSRERCQLSHAVNHGQSVRPTAQPNARACSDAHTSPPVRSLSATPGPSTAARRASTRSFLADGSSTSVKHGQLECLLPAFIDALNPMLCDGERCVRSLVMATAGLADGWLLPNLEHRHSGVLPKKLHAFVDALKPMLRL